MDLAEVECITVVGAAYNSEQDHAWNMVKLDGEWYCVDVTWDNSGDNQSDRDYAIHRYFNVTSAHLRSTDHQWDYENVPEATADRYRWNGVDELPT
jgi:transglutaminase/protease-like cytokinesis protein 3